MPKKAKKKSKCAPAPAWLMAYSLKVKDALWLNEWHVTVKMDDLSGEDTDGIVTADCTPSTPYLSAVIRFDPKHFRNPTPEAKTIIIHEYLHIVMGRSQRVADRTLELTPKKFQNFLDESRKDACEETIERLARALYPLIERIPDAPEPETTTTTKTGKTRK